MLFKFIMFRIILLRETDGVQKCNKQNELFSM